MKRSFWIVLCALALLAAWLLWPSGGRPAPLAKNAAAPAPVALSPAAQIAARKAALATAVTNSLFAKTNHFAYRLSNTTKSIGQLASDHHAILLDNALIQTDAKMDLRIPAHLRAVGEPGAYLVQSRGAINGAFRAALAAAGAKTVSYIPNNALLVQLTSAGAAALAGNSLVQAVLPYDPYFKVQSSLLGLAVKQQPLAKGTYLTLGLFSDGATATAAQIQKLGGIVVATDRSPFGPIVRVQPPADWLALAQLPGVQLLEPAHRRVAANDLSRSVTGVAFNSVAPTNYLNLTGTNVIVEVNDTGIDTNHPDLSGRVLLDAPGSGYDTDGHGTFVAGQIAGSGLESTTVTNAQGSIMPGTNGQFRGKAPAASLFSVGAINGYYRGGLFESGNDDNFFVIGQTNFFLPGAANYVLGPAGETNYFYVQYPDWYLQEAPAATNALISNNSWGNEGANEYDLAAASYDAAVRDALPEKTGPQPVLFVFAAGNRGNADGNNNNNNGGGGSPDTIASPATAKNVITVGALEQQRYITNTYLPFGSTNPVEAWYGDTDDGSQVAGFSARGNVGIGTEGTYGRFKPDVVAPGSFVVSTRSTTWDEVTYYNPTNFYFKQINDETVAANSLNYYSLSDFGFTAKSNVVSLTIQIFNTVPNVTNMPIYVSVTTYPDATNNDFSTAKNNVNIPLDSPPNYLSQIVNNGGDFNFSVGNPTNVAVKYNMFLEVVTTNDMGNYYEVLSNLNNSIGTSPYYYRYESGTSMAAADVSGVLALMQDYFTNTLHTTPSPALLKAMLINGARLTGFYNLQVNNLINYEGWGLVNLPNSIPPTLTNTVASTNNSVFFIDQSPANALATGDTRTYQISIPPNSQAQPLRVTLAWTDPPGNPAAAIKLVNNLSLTVSNLDNATNPVVYYGNDIETNQVYNTAQNPTNSTAVLDTVNNVQNVFLSPHAGTNFAIVVSGAAVNVNAVTTQTNNAAGVYAPDIAQDFVLVVSCGDGSSTNGFSITSTSAMSNPTGDQRVTVIVSTNSPLMNQIVGASSPVMSTNTLAFPAGSPYVTNALLTIGQTNQWHFYVVTNSPSHSADYTNAAFITFLPQTLAIPRQGVFAGSDANATLPEANIDLFVASGPGAEALTNLDATVIANCISNSATGGAGSFYASALSRGGTKFIVSSNSAPGQVYYIGVQSEDQMASEYAFLAEFSNVAFSQMTTNGEVVQFSQVEIPDGPASLPGYTNTIGLAIYPIEMRRVIVTNILAVQNAGDIAVSLNHSTTANANSSVNLMSHNAPNLPGTYTMVYDDSKQGDVSNSIPTAGPGSLQSYVRQQGQGVWILHASDNAPGFLGNIQGSLLLQPHQDLQHGVYVTVQPNSWYYDYVDVPVGYTNLIVAATNVTVPPSVAPPVTLYLNYNTDPTFSNYLAKVDLVNGVPPGGSISYGPPLTPGPYYIGLYNASALPQTIYVIATLAFSASAAEAVDYASTGPVPILDDAVTYSYIDVPRTDQIQGINVGLRVDHPRISDLVFHLISPDGTRYLLMENRGGQSTNGCGATYVTTNMVSVSANGTAQPNTNVINTGSTSGSFPITYNFYTAPDQMTIYYGTNISTNSLIFDTGMVSNPPRGGGGPQNTQPISTNVPYGPTNGILPTTYLTIVMNQFSNSNPKTVWTYTTGGVVTNYAYLSFTEDTNLTTTPIKFAPPPLVPQTVFSSIVTDSFEAYPVQPYTQGAGFGGWSVATNQVEVATNLNAYTGVNYLQLDNGVVSANVPTVPGQKYALTYWLASSVSEDTNGLLTASTNADWMIQYYNFTAVSTNTTVVLAASAAALTGLTFTNAQMLAFDTNALIDDVMLIQLPGNLYYQAEQSLSPLINTSAYGKMNNGDPWQLEILDTRAGATNNATLLSWQLNFTFANTNFTLSTITLTNGGPVTNFIPGGATQWYLVTAPTNADWATNSLLFATLPLNLWWSTNVPPTITNTPNDVELLAGSTNGLSVIGTNPPPAYFVPGSTNVAGGTYYLGVQNPNVAGANYAIDVTFHLLFFSPTVITKPATNLVTGSATLQALVTPNGGDTTVYFEYGLTTNYGTISSTSTLLTNNYLLAQWVTNDVTGLAPPGAVYHFQAIGTNIFGTNYGGDLIFTNPYATPAPFATTLPATRLTGAGAQLNGMATANGTDAQAWFEWGTSTAYGVTTPPVAIGTNYNVVFVTTNITGLITNLPYHYRLVVSNIVGVTYGFDQIFDQANVVVWGADFFGQTTPLPSTLTNLVVGVGAGYDFSLAVNNDGSVVAWGDDTFGQTNVPAGLNNAVAVAGGERSSLALRSDRTVLVWGSGQFGQTNTPTNLTNAVAAACGGFHCLALRDTGNVASWGVSSFGQTNVPIGLTNVVAVAAGDLHSLALKNDGTVIAWGYNGDGETNVPPGLTNVVAVAAGYYHNLALRNDGTVVAWGYDGNNQTNVPAGATNVVAIAAGGYHSLALQANGKVLFWGDSSAGQLTGYPTNLSNVVAIAAGGFHSLALSSLYGLNQTNTAPFWTNGLNGTTLTMNELTTNLVNNVAADSNTPAQLLQYSLISPSPAWAGIGGFSGVITLAPQEADGPGTNTITTVVTDNGFPALSTTNSFTLVVNEVNTPPYWPTNVPGQTNFTVSELTLLTVTNTASDSDIPTNTWTYALSVSGGVTNAQVSTNGIITWTPTEAQGPGTYTFTTIATDTNQWALVNKSLTATNHFTVTVLESNSAPFWTNAFPTVVMDELTTNIVVATAQDADLPTNTLSYALTNSPAWALIDTNTGVITLKPLEADGPGTNQVTVTVTDNGAPVPLSATTNFTVIVNEVNVAPQFILTPASQTVLAGTTLVITNAATDSDIPTNTLTYSLLAPPSGAAVDTNTGVLTLTLLAGTNLITTVVTDTNLYALTNQTLSATNQFTVIVTNVPVPAVIPIASIVYTNIAGTNGFLLTWFAPSNDLFQVQWTTSLAPASWQAFSNPPVVSYNTNVPVGPTNAQFNFFDDGTQTGGFGPTRFYRLLLLTNAPNTAPFFGSQPTNYFVTPTATLTVSNGATDGDLPPQTLTYALAGAPVGVSINPGSGLITWTPTTAQAGTTNSIITIVTDSGMPALSATNLITVFVNPLPVLASVTYGTNGMTLHWSGWTNEQFQVNWTTNLAPPSWTPFSGTVTSTNGVFTFVDTNTTFLTKFYQLILLP